MPSAPSTGPAIDLQLLADLPALPLKARYLVEGYLNGQHRSPLKGHSVEFAEYRAYQPGDDLRHLDWRYYGRSDRLCVKRFEEETQLRVVLLLDASLSMDYRSGAAPMTKLDYARVVLAALATLVRRQHDAAGVGILRHDLTAYLPARSSRSHLQDVINRLGGEPPLGKCDAAFALSSLAAILKRRAMVVIASDFYEESPALAQALRRLRYAGHEVIGLQVLDPLEMDLSPAEAGYYQDAETGVRFPVSPGEVRRSYLAQFQEFRDRVNGMFREVGGDFIELRTDEAPIRALGSYLAKREHRR